MVRDRNLISSHLISSYLMVLSHGCTAMLITRVAIARVVIATWPGVQVFWAFTDTFTLVEPN